MSIGSFAIIGVVAAGLSATLALQLHVRPAREPPFHPGHPLHTTLSAPAAVRGRTGQWVATLLARPLFSPSRRPAISPAPASGPAALPRLSGILVSHDRKIAIFAGGDKLIVLREGGQLANYSVQSIEPDRVTLHGGKGEQVVLPSFEPDEPTVASQISDRAPPHPALLSARRIFTAHSTEPDGRSNTESRRFSGFGSLPRSLQ